MSFELDQYDVVLLYPPAEVVLEMYDIPDFPNIGIAYLGNYLEQHKGITPALVDAKLSRLNIEETAEKIIALNPKIIGVGAMTPMIITAAKVFELVKEALPDVVTILGGFHASELPERTLNEFPIFDYIAVGEGELAFSEFCENILAGGDGHGIQGIWYRDGDQIPNMGRGEIPPTLDELGEPGWHLYEQDILLEFCKTLPVMGQRGCPFNCTFCSRPYGRTVRKRTPALIADEIRSNIDRYHPKIVHFYDETFSVDRKHTLALCDEMINRNIHKEVEWTNTLHANTIDQTVADKMKEAGCSYVGYGVESGDDDIIAQMKKGVTKERIIKARKILKKSGITTMGFFMMGHPNETRKSLLRTIRFAIKLNPDVAAIGILVPYPGTEIWEMANRGEGGYDKLSVKWEDYNKQLGNAVQLKNISRREIEFFQLLGYASIFIFNFRIIDLLKLTHKHIRLISAMVMKVLLPAKARESLMLFRNDGGRMYKEKQG